KDVDARAREAWELARNDLARTEDGRLIRKGNGFLVHLLHATRDDHDVRWTPRARIAECLREEEQAVKAALLISMKEVRPRSDVVLFRHEPEVPDPIGELAARDQIANERVVAVFAVLGREPVVGRTELVVRVALADGDDLVPRAAQSGDERLAETRLIDEHEPRMERP